MIEKGKYKHFKGNLYEVLDFVTHSETLETYVLYTPLNGEGRLWVRPLSMFEEKVEVKGSMVYRFEKID